LLTKRLKTIFPGKAGSGIGLAFEKGLKKSQAALYAQRVSRLKDSVSLKQCFCSDIYAFRLYILKLRL
jgi:hypothetical protein